MRRALSKRVEDEVRCQRVKIPATERVHRTKAQLALAMVETARARGLGHQWVGGDEIYGNNRELTDALEDLGEIFLMDVASNLKVWDRDPRPQSPQSKGNGRPPTRAQARVPEARAQSISALAADSFEKEHRQVVLRETTKGPLHAQLWVRAVWLWDPRHDTSSRRRLLIVRREANGSCKYSLSNAPAQTTWERLGWMQAQRFFIERAFQDAKSELGMAQYEVRGWRGWHHHITLCCLALLFTLKERLCAAEHTPLLSVRDIVELLAFYLPRRTRDPDELLLLLNARHSARTAAIISARKCRKKITK
jgi:SRSO17 transposase